MNNSCIVITQLACDYCRWFSLFGRYDSKSLHPWLHFSGHRLKWTEEPVSHEFLWWSGTCYYKEFSLLCTWIWGMLLLLPCSGFTVLLVGFGTTLSLWRLLFVAPIAVYFQMMIDSHCASAAVFQVPLSLVSFLEPAAPDCWRGFHENKVGQLLHLSNFGKWHSQASLPHSHINFSNVC